MQSDGINLRYFKLRLSDLTEFIDLNILGSKNIGIRKLRVSVEMDSIYFHFLNFLCKM